MIQGFPFQSSLFPGDALRLHVSSDAPEFRVDIYRLGATLHLVLSSQWFASPGIALSDHDADQDWSQTQGSALGWPPFDIAIPSSFKTGVYIAMFVEGDGMGNPRGNTPPLDATTPDARFAKSLFVVRNPVPSASILYKLPLFTYHAYCDVGGWSLYTPLPSRQGQPTYVSLRRPGGGTGGHPWDDWNFDPADGSSARQVFAHWDAPFIAWLERNGYVVDYATDLDLHSDPNLLAPYSLVLSVGHDEYWTKEMRDQAETFIQQGGNFAFFSGNTCWWVVEFDGSFRFQRTVNWWDGGKRPENSLTGVSFRNAGEGNEARPKVGYVVQNQNHWVFDGTGLADGDPFGTAEWLVGYESDGANFDRSQGPPFVAKGDDGTPSTFVILGVGDVTSFDTAQGNAAATMGVYTRGGTAFTGATTDWPRVVGLNAESNTVQITVNVLNRLSHSTFYSQLGKTQLATYDRVLRVGGFYSDDDGYRHALVNTGDGQLHEIFYNPATGQGDAILSDVGNLLGLAGFFTPDDSFRHAIVADANQSVREIFYSPASGLGDTTLATYGSIVDVGGFFSPDDDFRHAIVATTTGDIHEIFFDPNSGQGDALLGNYEGVVATAGFYSNDDSFRHAIVATAGGDVYEIFFNPNSGQGSTVIAHLEGILSIGAFFSDSDQRRRVLIATNDGVVHEIAYHPRLRTIHTILGEFDGLVGVAGFYTPDDGFNHAIVGTTDGAVFEIFYKQ
jgi:hypothetical protein